jgi:coenzyme F420 hydrogenase subunit beta
LPFRFSQFRHVGDVADWRLCLGCGACAYICPSQAVKLVDFIEEGIRPVVDESRCGDCQQCLQVCPAVETDFGALRTGVPRATGSDQTDGQAGWGEILEIWEGHATDESIRFKGSSGGVLTALSAYCIEKVGMQGVLHIGQDPIDPIRNRTMLSRSRDELVAATGSRYSPASVCDSLARVELARSPCVIIGKPAEISAVTKARKLRPKLDQNVGVTLSFFCAESPSTAGTAELLSRLGVSPETVSDLRYRGNGWPGDFSTSQKGHLSPVKLSYRESWAFLQAYRPWSVQMWPDGSGELADISCGDPWYEKPDGVNPGFSLVVVRTEQGRSILRGAIDAGYITLRRADKWKLDKSQGGLLKKKAAVWGRLLAMRLCGLPVPNYLNGFLFECWLKLPLREKLQSTAGTLRRIIARQLYRPLKLRVPFGRTTTDRSTVHADSVE